MRLVPWAGVAARLATTASPPTDSAAAGSEGEGEGGNSPPRGAAYCFLPLPVNTGLPVHVNGYFELSSNRYCKSGELYIGCRLIYDLAALRHAHVGFGSFSSRRGTSATSGRPRCEVCAQALRTFVHRWRETHCVYS